MATSRALLFWIAALLVAVFLPWLLKDILLPFAGGIVLAYMQVPLADRLERLGMNRTRAALLIVGIVVLILLLLTVLLLPILSEQALALIESLPGYVRRLQALLTDLGSSWLERSFGDDASKTLPQLISQGAGQLSGLLGSLWSSGKATISFISVLVIMPVIAFYLICDWHNMIDTLDSWVPPRCRQTVRQIMHDIDAAISGFLRGQAGICLLIGLFYAVGLSLVGLNSALLIGLVSGALSFVPFVGSLLGLVIGTTVAIQQFWPQWIPIAIVIAIFLTGQFIAGYVLGPKLVGDKVGLHPVWLIFAMFAFGYLFGFVGLLIAVPLGAAVGVLFRFGLTWYFDS